jgi:hypothetical protein
VVSAFAAVMVAGCGSGDGDTVSTVPTVPKAQILARGNAVCARENAVIQKAFNRFGEKVVARGRIASQTELDAVTAKVVLPARKREVRKLRALGVPDKGAADFKRMLAAMEDGIERAEDDRSTLLGSGSSYAFAAASEAGLRFGMTRCWLE